MGCAGGAEVGPLVVADGGGGAVGTDAVVAVGAMVVRSLGAMMVLLLSLLSLGVHVVAGWGWELTNGSMCCTTVELNKRQVGVQMIVTQCHVHLVLGDYCLGCEVRFMQDASRLVVGVHLAGCSPHGQLKGLNAQAW